MGFIVGLLIGVALGVLSKDVWRRLQFYFLLNIAANRQKQERKQAIKDLEDFINKDEGA